MRSTGLSPTPECARLGTSAVQRSIACRVRDEANLRWPLLLVPRAVPQHLLLPPQSRAGTRSHRTWLAGSTTRVSSRRLLTPWLDMARGSSFYPSATRDTFRDVLIFEERLKQNAER
jgi:hypothetical protein